MRAGVVFSLVVLFPFVPPKAFSQERAAPAGGQPAAPADAAAKEPAFIEGSLLNAVTGEPVRKANLMLMLSGSGGTMGVGGPQTTVAASDGDGKFTFEKLEPGRYSLTAEKTGFVRQQYGSRAGQMGAGTAITLAPGQKMKLEFKLTPQAVISGKVLDEDGEPVTRAMVQVFRQVAYSRRPQGMMGMGTNDVGEFRIANLAPGKYTIRADYRRMFGTATQPQPTGDQGTLDYVSTFYPNATDVEAAAPIAVGAGQEVSRIEIRLQKARVYRVRGKIMGVASDPSSRVQVSLEPQKRSNMSMMVFGGGGNVKPDGSFEVASVLPGAYFVTAMRFDTGRPQVLARVPVTVSSGNVDGVTLHAGTPINVAGRVAVEGDDKAKVTGQVYFASLESVVFGVQPSRIQDDGTFKIDGVSRDKYSVSIMGLPEGMYVKRVRVGNTEVPDTGLDLSQADSVAPLEVIVGTKGATIEGVVKHEDKPWAGASITLLPEPMRPDRRFLQRTANSDQNGRFTLKGVAPGEYKLYAWEEFVQVFDMDPDQLKPFEGHAAKLKIKEEAREQVELKLVPPPQQ